jgi:PAS domain S-box-containing protein
VGLRLNIGPRLTLCFAFIILLMLGGDSVVLWQFHVVRLQSERLNGSDQELTAVLRVHASLLAFHDKLEEIANDEDSERLVAEARPLNSSILDNMQHARSALGMLPSSIHPDPTILPTLQVIQRTMESQLEEITDLATSGDWSAVRLRLANQVQPLEFLSSTLVEKVDHEVSEEQTQAALNIRRVQRRVFMVVPITVLCTLLIAGTLGLAITRSITRPLARLVEGSKMLARGEFQYQVAIHGEDELAHLGQVFNDTARQLQDLYASLQNSEDRLRRVINTIPAHVWSTLPNGSVDFINQRLLESTGLLPEDLLGSGWHSIVHPDDLARYTDEWRLTLATGEPAETEARVWTAHRDYRWMLIRNVPLRDGVGNIVKWYGTGIDIEDRKRAEEQLRRSEAYLTEAQRLTRTGSFARQISTDEIVWSEETYQIFGYDNAAKPSLELFIDRVHPDDKNLVRQVLEQVSGDGTGFDTEHRLLMPDGAVKYLHMVAHTMRDSSGLEFIGAVTDISPAKQAEEALRKAQSDLAHVNRVTTMGELSASLAHEINQPISGAMINASTCLRWLKREHPGLDEASEAASRMIRDVNRAAEIISRIRLFFRKGTLLTESVDVNEIIREMIVLLHNEATRHSILVRTELTTDLPLMMGDRVQLQQVLMNLMINGIDAMKNVDEPRQLTLRSRRDDNEQFLVSVDDTGVGLPTQQTDQIFNAFFTTKSHGTGMGLRISRTIIEAHGGRLWASDNYPRGAIFHFTLATKASVDVDNGARSIDGPQ